MERGGGQGRSGDNRDTEGTEGRLRGGGKGGTRADEGAAGTE